MTIVIVVLALVLALAIAKMARVEVEVSVVEADVFVPSVRTVLDRKIDLTEHYVREAKKLDALHASIQRWVYAQPWYGGRTAKYQAASYMTQPAEVYVHSGFGAAMHSHGSVYHVALRAQVSDLKGKQVCTYQGTQAQAMYALFADWTLEEEAAQAEMDALWAQAQRYRAHAQSLRTQVRAEEQAQAGGSMYPMTSV